MAGQNGEHDRVRAVDLEGSGCPDKPLAPIRSLRGGAAYSAWTGGAGRERG